MNSVVAVGFNPTEVQWFDISNIGRMETVKIDKLATHKPPFNKSLVLWAGTTKSHPYYEMMMIVAGSDPEEGVVIDLSKGPPGKRITFPPLVYIIDNGQIKYGPVDDGEQIPTDVAEVMLSMVSIWFDSLDSGCNSYRPEVKPTFTNRRKIAQGKLPTYDWLTVKIGPRCEKQASKGGTHASPRLHDRRGHIRRLQTGKNVWVKQCKVGDASIGTVFHDYQIQALQ